MTQPNPIPSNDQKQPPMLISTTTKVPLQSKPKLIEEVHYDSQFMQPPSPKNGTVESVSRRLKRAGNSSVLSRGQVQGSLREIHSFYSRAYIRQIKQAEGFDIMPEARMKMQSFLLFAKHFGLLRAIFPLERLTIIFKKYGDYGKYLSFDNFLFLINSIAHQTEAKLFFNLTAMLDNLDIQTKEELQKQELYNYLGLGDPEKYRPNFKELFHAFNCQDKPRIQKLKYNYRKFSLPELRKKAIPQHKEKKKGQKDLFILKNDSQTHQKNVFDEAKSIVVSWQSLRAKSVNNLGKPSDLLQKKYLKIDPEQDPYLSQLRPDTRLTPKGHHSESQQKSKRLGKIQQKIREIQQKQSLKNKQILSRIDKKVQVRSSHKLLI